MDTTLTRNWEHIASLKEDLLARVAALPVEEQGASPAPGEWSPLHVIAHLVTAETFVLGYEAPTKVSVNPPPPPLHKRAMIGLLCAMLRAAIPLPAPEVMEPPKELQSLETITADWAALREKLHTSLDGLHPNTIFGLHPILGPVTVAQVLGMTETHLIYHTKRFPRARKKAI